MIRYYNYVKSKTEYVDFMLANGFMVVIGMELPPLSVHDQNDCTSENMY